MHQSEKLDKLESILNIYGKSIKLNEDSFCSTYTVFSIINEVWQEIKPCEKEKIVDILL